MKTKTCMKIPWNIVLFSCVLLFYISPKVQVCRGQDEDIDAPPPLPLEEEECNGIFLSLHFHIGDRRHSPRLKNASAQAWAFKSTATVMNTGLDELKAWKIFIGFQHEEILVSADGAVIADGDDFPAAVGNGTYLSGDYLANTIAAKVVLTWWELNACMLCKGSKIQGQRGKSTKFSPRRNGDLSFSYDVLQASDSNYLAQVTIDNKNPIGRLDHWNLTWEWMRGEFIYNMRGAFTQRPVIVDLPADRAKDEKVGNLPYCCRNGSLLPSTMDVSRSRSVFQLQVYKLPPDLNRTALFPPQNWEPWQVGKWSATSLALEPSIPDVAFPFSAFYNDSVVPCNTCACGCEESDTCSADANPLLLPSEALLVPFDNRTARAKAWAKVKHYPVPDPLPCPDNCRVSINWHIYTDYRTGWTARISIFNWDDVIFEDWFGAIVMEKTYPGYENVYSFNGTKLPQLNNTIFFEGLPGLNYLMGETNGTNPKRDPRVPGKQQSIISFTKKQTPGINLARGDGFPSRVFFNGEECSLPAQLPLRGGQSRTHVSFLPVVFLTVALALLRMSQLQLLRIFCGLSVCHVKKILWKDSKGLMETITIISAACLPFGGQGN
ncbi:COBRA-like protein 10 [Vitis vinifera]|uniref:COBRA-like protein 10 n=1 Tax=Vitis vinifera TaxID=29760 RepID=A0A438DY23_VITVI|nr:COBRA-like protein 10 [Vitis vinifera]